MAKKPVLLIALLAVIGSLFMYVNRDAFRRQPIQISHRLYRFAGRFSKPDAPLPVMFEFDRRLKLTSIKIVALADIQTNKYPQPLWQMVSSSNSVPTKGFVYGMDVPGMRPALNGVAAEPLDPRQTYRLLVEAGSLKGQHDFTLEPGSGS
jgi:hypothetical protein